MCLWPVSAVHAEQSIHALRGAYLYYFSHFIEWPEQTSFDQGAFELCALTDDASDRYQLYTINGKSIGSVKLRISVLEKDQSAKIEKCHMLFVSDNYARWLTLHVAQIASHTLLVTEGDAKPKGAVHLFIDHQKLKFSIDQKQLKAQGFKASSKLLRLSRGRGNDE